VKTRHVLARIAAVVTAAAAIGMFLPARADAAKHAPDSSASRESTSSMAQQPGSGVDGSANRDQNIGAFSPADALGSELDGWGNRDLDIGAFNGSMAEELGSRLDGWDTPEMDLNPTALREAMAFGIGCRLDGWANRDQDIW
jgi:hypothetical protein